MKKLIYEDEKIKLFPTLIGIVIIVFSLLLLFLVVGFAGDALSRNFCYFMLLLFIVVALYLLKIGLIDPYIIRKKHRKIRQLGARMEGYIEFFYYNVSYETIAHEHNDNTIEKRKDINLTVSYYDPSTGEKKLYKTPNVIFDPAKDLGSRKCYVYFLNDIIYVSDFVPNSDNINIWNENDKSILLMNDSLRKFNEEKLMYIKFGIFIFIVFLIISFIVSLLQS